MAREESIQRSRNRSTFRKCPGGNTVGKDPDESHNDFKGKNRKRGQKPKLRGDTVENGGPGTEREGGRKLTETERVDKSLERKREVREGP